MAPGSTYLEATVQVTVKASSFRNSELHLKPTSGPYPHTLPSLFVCIVFLGITNSFTMGSIKLIVLRTKLAHASHFL